ncbi:MAG: glycogen synthase GlgA [Bryobacteraceae bacterium]|nr:glycogen synthase GlgA [Bryobacteraceae bacterium]
MAKILMVSSEAAPLAKTGGLADVVGSLPAALRKLGHDVAVVLPRYGRISLQGARRIYNDLPVSLAGIHVPTSVFQVTLNDVPFYLLDSPALFDRPGLYGENNLDYVDNPQRFAVLALGSLAIARHIFRPNVFHLHDWQASLVPVYLRGLFQRDPTLIGIRTLLTIHNLGYQGRYHPSYLRFIGLDPWQPGALEFWGDISFLKGGILLSDALNTVSPRYAQEIQTPEFGFGMDGLLRSRSADLTGILNGVDYGEWNPETDSQLPANYSAADLSGKRVCKRELLKEFGLPVEDIDTPLIGIVSRFADMKGFDLIAHAAGELAGLDMKLVALGTGEPQYENLFRTLAWNNPYKVSARIAYDNRLAHLIEAGSDMFLMPSRYEPCGLNQMYSLRYGTIPLVRATGGLDDTIGPGTGFKFWDYSGHSMLQMIRYALAQYQDREEWTAMMRRAMAEDYSWEVSAGKYSELYRHLLEPKAASAVA